MHSEKLQNASLPKFSQEEIITSPSNSSERDSKLSNHNNVPIEKTEKVEGFVFSFLSPIGLFSHFLWRKRPEFNLWKWQSKKT